MRHFLAFPSILRSAAVFGLLLLPCSAMAQCELAQVRPSNPQPNTAFGETVSISGTTAVVGDREYDGYEGAVYVYKKQGPQWVEAQILQSSDPSKPGKFGVSVAIDGSTLVIGENFGGQPGVPSYAYVFEEGPSGWTEMAKLTGAIDDTFGSYVAVDGGIVVATAPGDDEAGSNSGAAYVYDNNGGQWTQTDKLLAPDGMPLDTFGQWASIWGDTIAIGAPWADVEYPDQGAIYLFTRVSGSWTFSQKLTANDGTTNDRFGEIFDITESRLLVGVGCEDEGGTCAGAAYVFEKTKYGWAQTDKIAKGYAYANVGGRVAISGDLLVISENTGAPSWCWTLKAYEKKQGIWEETANLLPGAGVNNCGVSAVSESSGLLFLGLRDGYGDKWGSVMSLRDYKRRLCGCPHEISLFAGGAQALNLYAGAAYAGLYYFVLGNTPANTSGSFGTTFGLKPFIPYPGYVLGKFGSLDASGQGQATYVIPMNTDPALAGYTVRHGALLIDPQSLEVLDTTNTVTVELVD